MIPGSPSLMAGRIQTVPDAPNRDEMDGPLGFYLDLRTEPAYVDVDRPRIAVMVLAPRTVKQLPA